MLIPGLLDPKDDKSSPPTLPEACVEEILCLVEKPENRRKEIVDELKARYSGHESEIDRCVAAAEGGATFDDLLESFGKVLPKAPHNHETDPQGMIGPYRILEKLGEGGMGSVFLAEQVTPVWRRVAIKLIKIGMDTKQVLGRFEIERQALALMEHQNIAKVLDAGASDDGRPYFVMELVKGMPINAYCDAKRLSIAERVELFREVCSGVQHAHQKGVIHRDLKPSNVLVAEIEGRATPKIIDFGLARATNQRLTETTIFTQKGQIIGTPEYMSPEQAGLNELDIDTRTDVYSLGAMFYELLTGELPIARENLRTAGLLEMQRMIREEEPPKPSTRIASTGKEPSSTPALPGMDWKALRKGLRGDLDWIVMRALEKERNRRYASPEHLSEDLRRHLAFEPVVAGPPSTFYRLKKVLRRHVRRVVAISLVAIAFMLGVATTSWQYGAASGREAALEQWGPLLVLRSMTVAAREDLWPAVPAMVGAMDAWLGLAAQIQERLPGCQEKLAALQAQAKPYTKEQQQDDRRNHPKRIDLMRLVERRRQWKIISKSDKKKSAKLDHAILELRQEIEGYRSYQFDDAKLKKQHDMMRELVEALQSWADAENGLPKKIEERKEAGGSLEKHSIKEHEAAWAKAIAAIKASDGKRASKLYGGLDIKPQLGLVPLGMDRSSKLWEFAHLLSGEKAPRSMSTGRLLPKEETGVVLVLIPGGTFRMGAQKTDPKGQNYDQGADKDEVPVQEVTLDPFFISKYEITQAQWTRIAGENPSHYQFRGYEDNPSDLGPLNPVEHVSWDATVDTLRKLALQLPTEAQWEYACRAGKATPFASGSLPKDLQDYANILDACALEHYERKLPGVPTREVDDGDVLHSSVGKLKPNAFGLHNMMGNVSEWCADFYCKYHEVQARAGDGLRENPGYNRCFRGGSWIMAARSSRSAKRQQESPDFRIGHLGLRPVRPLDPR